MGLDVYVGSLTHYYSGRWETAGQTWAREYGVPMQTIQVAQEDGSGEMRLGSLASSILRQVRRLVSGRSVHDDTVSHQRGVNIQSVVTAWRDKLNQQFADVLKQPLDWDESDASPYFTGSPAWDGYGSLVLLAAHDEHPDLARPATPQSQWHEDSAWLRASADQFRDSRYRQILAPELWLPCPFDVVFDSQDPAGQDTCIGSSVALLSELRRLHSRTSPGRLEERGDSLKNGIEGASFDDAALFGLTVFLDLAERSVSYRLPLKLDY